MPWKPSTELTGYDEERVNRLLPISRAIAALSLPIDRARNLHAILAALEVQIEEGGDHPEVNRHLLDAVREGVVHQVGKRRAAGVLRAIDAFSAAEDERWAQVRAGTLPPISMSPVAQLDDLMQRGYTLVDARKLPAAMDLWLEAWQQVKQLATPEMRTATAFDEAYPGMMQCVFNWSSDLEMELGNAGFTDPAYYEHRIRYADEFLAQFPDEEDWRYVMMLRAKGEALFSLHRQDAGEAVYAKLVERCPDEAWSYIGWADQYVFLSVSAQDYGRAEQILKRALDRPALQDRLDAVERLASLYGRWGRADACREVAEELPEDRRRALMANLARRAAAKPVRNLGRNDPCWCGSGKKYKNCHMRSDKAAT